MATERTAEPSVVIADDLRVVPQAEYEAIRVKHEEAMRKNSKLLDERSKLSEQAESFSARIALYERTRDHLPIGGVTCDEDGCDAAIGIVGIKIIDVDKMNDAIEPLAVALGWTITDGKHGCPKHGKKPTL